MIGDRQAAAAHAPAGRADGRGGPMAGLGMPAQKAKDFKGTLLRLLGYFAPAEVGCSPSSSPRRSSARSSASSGRRSSAWPRRSSSKGYVRNVHGACPGGAIDFAYIGQILC